MKNKYQTKVEKATIKCINYIRNLFKTAQFINDRQIKQRAYELLEKEHHDIIAEYIASKVYKIEIETTRYTMEELRTLNLIKYWLKK